MANEYFSEKYFLKSESHTFQETSGLKACISNIVISSPAYKSGNDDLLACTTDRSLQSTTNTTKRKPTVVHLRYLQKKAKVCSSPSRNKNENILIENVPGKKYTSAKVLSFNQDPDLKLLDNLDWLINFQVRTLFHYVLDETPIDDINHPQLILNQCMEDASINVPELPKEFKVFENEWQDDSARAKLTTLSVAPTFLPLPRLRNHSCGKPTLTYSQLIESCLREKGALTVQEIYKWISNRYPFYEDNNDGWKNAVRHNLSMQSQFKKGEKVYGKSHIWYLDHSYRKEPKGCFEEPVDPVTEKKQDQMNSPWDNLFDRSDANGNLCSLKDREVLRNSEGTNSADLTYLGNNEEDINLFSAPDSRLGMAEENVDNNHILLEEIKFETNADQGKSWQHLNNTIPCPTSNADQNIQDWMMTNEFSPLVTDFGEYTGVSPEEFTRVSPSEYTEGPPSVESFLQTGIQTGMPKLECFDLIGEFVVKEEVTNDELLQALEAFSDDNNQLS